MNLFQIGLLFSFPVQTYLLTCETGYWSIFIYVYMLGCVKCHVYFSTFVFANESWFFLCRVLSFIFYWFRIVRRKLTIPERWQAVGMYNGGLSHRRVADHFRVNHSIIVRLMQRFRQTGYVTDRPRSGWPRKATPREDRLISRRAQKQPFSTAGALRGNLAFGGHISTHTVIRRLHHQEMPPRRPITRPQLTLRHRRARFDWSHDHLGWTICTWRRVHWSDKSFFATPYRRSCKGLAPTKHFISGQPHFGHNCFWEWGCNCRVVFPLTVSWTCTFLMMFWQAKNTVTMCSLHA
jgi:transposase